MSPRHEPRTEPGGRSEATVRLNQARKFLDVAELVAVESELPSSASVSASLAVLAGIAAADAACYLALGRRSRGQAHAEASRLVERIEPGGKKAAQAFRRLIDLKDTAHYGIITVTPSKLEVALRDARNLVDFARDVANR